MQNAEANHQQSTLAGVNLVPGCPKIPAPGSRRRTEQTKQKARRTKGGSERCASCTRPRRATSCPKNRGSLHAFPCAAAEDRGGRGRSYARYGRLRVARVPGGFTYVEDRPAAERV